MKSSCSRCTILESYCKGFCRKCYKANYYEENKEYVKNKVREHRIKNPEHVRNLDREEYKRNKNKHLDRCKKYVTENPEKVKVWRKKSNSKPRTKELKINWQNNWRISNREEYLKDANYRNSLRRASKKQRTPKWLSKEHKNEIKIIYANRPEGYHVDHIIPLSGKTVCGLHVPWNLQYLKAEENLTKHNKLIIYPDSKQDDNKMTYQIDGLKDNNNGNDTE